MARILIKELVKTFGSYKAVNGIDLEIRDGEFLIIVGPSGCGKTTTINMISGLETPTCGQIVIGDTVFNDLEPGERGLGMVFQDLALFPHMTVFENIAFGLRVKKLPEITIRERVAAAAAAYAQVQKSDAYYAGQGWSISGPWWHRTYTPPNNAGGATQGTFTIHADAWPGHIQHVVR